MNAREEVLARVRAAVSAGSASAGSVSGGSVAAEQPPVPRDYLRAHEPADRVGMFAERVADYRATVTRTTADGVAAVVAERLGGARRVVVPAGVDPAWVPDGVDVVRDEPQLLTARELDRTDAVLTSACVGIAVTGTIVLDHTAGQGRRALTLVPDLHVCVVTADQVVGDVPQAVARLQASVDAGRPLTWISGPSATSDIELDRVEGVHGPRTLHVVLVDPDAAESSHPSDPTGAVP